MTLFLILRNLDQKCGESICLALQNILFLFLMYRLIVVVIHGGSEGHIYQHRRPGVSASW